MKDGMEGIIQAGDGNAFLIAGLCIFNCRFMYFYYAENNGRPYKRKMARKEFIDCLKDGYLDFDK